MSRHASNRNRVVRTCLLLLIVLSDGQLHSSAELQQLIGRCYRTLKRYLDALDECGFKVESDERADGMFCYQLVNPAPARRLRALLVQVPA